MYQSDLSRLKRTGLSQTDLNQKENLLVLLTESLGESQVHLNQNAQILSLEICLPLLLSAAYLYANNFTPSF